MRGASASSGPAPVDTSQLPIPLPSFLQGNEYFTAAFGVALLGVGLQLTKRVGVGLQLFATRQLLTTLEVSNRDASFPWILRWLQSQTEHKTRRVSVETAKRQTQSGKSITNFTFVPSQGTHFLRYKNNFFMVKRDRELRARGGGGGSNDNTSIASSSGIWETITFTTVGRNANIYESLMKEAQMMATSKDHDYTTIYTSWGHQGWKPFGNPRFKRDINSVILDKGISEQIVDDLYEFLISRPWYHERGIPYRRGYLLYGEPGSGKSSFVTALAGHIGYDICVMSLAQPGLTDDHLAISLINVPEKSLILFEDIDCLFTDRADSSLNQSNVTIENSANNSNNSNKNSNKHSKLRNKSGNENRNHYSNLTIQNSNNKQNDYNYITFSGFLNALDGVSAGEERIVFMTTNYVNKLDSALIRPGRIDNMQYFGAATNFQIEKMFLRFYPEKDISNPLFFQKFENIHKQLENATMDNIDNIDNSNDNNDNNNDTIDSNKNKNKTNKDSINNMELLNEYYQCKSLLKTEIDKFVKTISGHGISMADLQEYFLLHKHSVDTALEDAQLFVETWLKSPRRRPHDNIQYTTNENTNTNTSDTENDNDNDNETENDNTDTIVGNENSNELKKSI